METVEAEAERRRRRGPESANLIAKSPKPSEAMSFRSDSKTISLKCSCSSSLTNLMHSCSKELRSRISKPNMSSSPT